MKVKEIYYIDKEKNMLIVVIRHYCWHVSFMICLENLNIGRNCTSAQEQ